MESEKSETKDDEVVSKPVGFSPRLFAYNIDITLLMISFVALSFLIENNIALYYTCAAIVLLYHAIFESSDWQGTVGKKYNKLKIVDRKGDRISFVIALVRVVLKVASFFLLFIGIFLIYTRKDRRSLHDLILGTYVIQDSNQAE
ncbi:MAG: RDD family protein [Cyclobacteriaceae bacterium]